MTPAKYRFPLSSKTKHQYKHENNLHILHVFTVNYSIVNILVARIM